ncbi:hypothetical protein RPMA_09030 [Tardiphaga alba]|uniref:Harpin HrpZ n=1 Tax=Tardiphaga alba TaxID=340268 RepID=A0ABX8A5T9_9BRAD|nr:hypothetical protein [Tardiphaga alba]QUS38952.1 hypothetical protein RPMA_09030 [Tardiphaga alba]
MTSISAASSSSYQSPLQKLQQELQAELTSGKISSGDQDALSAALDSIDSSMRADRGSASGGTRPSPDEMKSKIDDLISAQVSSGNLTSDQAEELKGVFEAAFADGPGGAKGAGGPPPGGGAGGPPPSDSADESDDTDSTTDIKDIMQQFLESLKQSLEASSSSYSASGVSASGNTTSFTALLLDYRS